jgi:splicing factor 3A subunit 1
MTLAQKRMAAMVMETTAEDVEAHRARQAAAEAQAAAGVGSAGVAADEDAPMEESDDEDSELRLRKRREENERVQELERAKAIQASSLDSGGPIKIRTDYVPKSRSLSRSKDLKLTGF